MQFARSNWPAQFVIARRRTCRPVDFWAERLRRLVPPALQFTCNLNLISFGGRRRAASALAGRLLIKTRSLARLLLGADSRKSKEVGRRLFAWLPIANCVWPTACADTFRRRFSRATQSRANQTFDWPSSLLLASIVHCVLPLHVSPSLRNSVSARQQVRRPAGQASERTRRRARANNQFGGGGRRREIELVADFSF